MYKRLLSLFFAVLFVVALTGCLSELPLDQYSYVIDMGVELGKRMKYNFVFMISVHDNSSEGGSSASVLTVSAEGRDIYEAIITMSASLPKQLNFSRMSLIVFSEILATNGHIPDVMDIDYGKLKIRENIRVLICRGAVREALEGLQTQSDPSMTKIKTNIENFTDSTGLLVDRTLREVLNAFTDETHDVFISCCAVNKNDVIDDMVHKDDYPYVAGNLLTEGDQKTSIIGTAVFSKHRMVGVLDGQNTLLLSMCTGDFKSGIIHMTLDDGTDVSLSVTAVKEPRITVNGSIAKVKLSLSINVESPAIMDTEYLDTISEQVKNKLINGLTAVFESVRHRDADVFGFGNYAVMHFTDTKAWENYKWRKVYANLSCEFDFNLRFIMQSNEGMVGN